MSSVINLCICIFRVFFFVSFSFSLVPFQFHSYLFVCWLVGVCVRVRASDELFFSVPFTLCKHILRIWEFIRLMLCWLIAHFHSFGRCFVRYKFKLNIFSNKMWFSCNLHQWKFSDIASCTINYTILRVCFINSFIFIWLHRLFDFCLFLVSFTNHRRSILRVQNFCGRQQKLTEKVQIKKGICRKTK